MTQALNFLAEAKANGFDFFTGVPCSFLTPLINATISDQDTRYVAATSEGEAIAIASGAWLAGKQTVVMFQNSGLGNAVNPLTSLNYPFRIPTLIICTWRAGPGLKDEPQHELMGEITPDLFEVMRIPHMPFPSSDDAISGTLKHSRHTMDETGLPVAMIMQKGDVDSYELSESGKHSELESDSTADFRTGSITTPRYTALESMLDAVSENTAIIATTGKCGRELFTIDDRRQHLYQVGSMGCAAGMGLGVALNSEKPVVVVDGDGALMMKMGSLATIGAYAPKKLIHLVLDNSTYDSTGGQPTVSPRVEFADAALAVGYAAAFKCDSVEGLISAFEKSKKMLGPSLLHMRIKPGSLDNLGRPSVSPAEVARRFQSFLAE